MGDYDCQRAVVPSTGWWIFLVRPLREPIAWLAGSPLVVGASLLRQVAALVYLSGRAVFMALTLRFYEIRERGRRIRSSWATAK
ncbi:hypothetical protein AB0941_01245 [Streptomyces sp. NPDC013433]|uniref:hypothetical protein n=1 Tax=Streptomyces sp. NPDC013433 TaxID=3155604 RepID=UPI0034541B7E